MRKLSSRSPKLTPKRLLAGDGPILLDEWQHAPVVWNAVRRAVDDGDPPGPFLLAASAVPRDGENEQLSATRAPAGSTLFACGR